MIDIIQENNNYIVKFRYDPRLVEIMHNVPAASWDKSRKVWLIHKNQLGTLLANLKGTAWESGTTVYSDDDINENETVDSTDEIPDIDISDVDIYVQDGFKLYDHQIDFLKWAKARGKRGFVLADEMGCGKTLETINYALYQRKVHGYKHCLILCCVNIAKFSWQSDIEKHTNHQEHGYIIGTRKRRAGGYKYDGSTEKKLQDLKSGKQLGKGDDIPYFLIMNIEALHAKSGKKYPIVEQLISMINSGEIGMVAIDECHRNMSPKSTQGKQILEIKKHTGDGAQWISITGTPITKRPTDVYTPLKLLDAHNFKNFWEWQQYFCIFGGFDDHEVIGYWHIPELKSMLQGNMIRRLKSEVLDLPPKIEFLEYVENTEYQQGLYTTIVADMMRNEEGIVSSMNPLAKFIRLRQVNGCPECVDDTLAIDKDYLNKNAKMRRALELIDEIIERGEKLVVFSQWVSPLKTLYRFIAGKYKVACYTGTMTEQKREADRQRFMNDPDTKIMIGTVGALGTSSTLVCANNLIFLDEPWNASDRSQVEDRINRIGAVKQSNIYTILSKDTVDDRVHQIMTEKGDIAKYIVDGEIDIRKNPELFRMLLGFDSAAPKRKTRK